MFPVTDLYKKTIYVENKYLRILNFRIQPDVAVSQVGDDDLDDGAQVVHEVQDEAKLQGSERLGGSMMTDVLV